MTVAEPTSRLHAGFSLTEIAAALAVVAFCVVGLLALLPPGLENFRQSMDTTITAQIAQRILGEAQESDFDQLVAPAPAASAKSTPEFILLASRYFDESGDEVVADHARRAIFEVRTRVSRPGASDPRQHGAQWFTSLPATGPRFNSRDMSIVTIQILRNSVGRDVPVTDALLVDLRAAKTAGLSCQTFTGVIARNGR